MDFKEILLRLNPVLRKVPRCQAFMLRKEGDKLVIKLVLSDNYRSDPFECVNKIDELISITDPELYNQYCLEYQIWYEGGWVLASPGQYPSLKVVNT